MIKDIIRQLMDVASAPNPQLALELALFNPDVVTVQSPPPAQHKAQAPTKQATPPKAPEPQPEPVVETATKPVEKTQEDETPVKTDISSATDAPTPGDWQDILSQLKGNHNTLYGIVRMATPSFEPGVVTLGFKFAFHKNRISDARYTDILAKTAQSVLGHPIKVLVVMDKSSGSDKPQEATPDKPSLNSITDIFGDDIAVSDA